MVRRYEEKTDVYWVCTSLIDQFALSVHFLARSCLHLDGVDIKHCLIHLHKEHRSTFTMSQRTTLMSAHRALQSLRPRPQARKLPSRHPFSSTSTSHPPRSYARTYTLPASAAALASLATIIYFQNIKSLHLDAAPSTTGDALTSGAKVQITGQDHGPDVEKVPTGTSTVPYFPKSIWLPRSGKVDDGSTPALPAGMGMAQEEEEYQLLGLGVRKVSLFRIEVYVVGVYVAKKDVARLQEEMVKNFIGSGASTLVGKEKEDLRKTLLDGKGSEELWSSVLKDGGIKSAVRIVPAKNTNFSHLRDGWIRIIDAKGKSAEFQDEKFKASVADFKAMMGGQGSVASGRTLLLGRGTNGDLKAWVERDAANKVEGPGRILTGKGEGMTLLGRIDDERVSRLVWQGYLSGDYPASEPARQSVVGGVIDLVERPIGTVETQVV